MYANYRLSANSFRERSGGVLIFRTRLSRGRFRRSAGNCYPKYLPALKIERLSCARARVPPRDAAALCAKEGFEDGSRLEARRRRRRAVVVRGAGICPNEPAADAAAAPAAVSDADQRAL